MAGIERGIDRDATWGLPRDSRTPAYERGIARAVICGGTWTGDRLQRCGVITEEDCLLRDLDGDHEPETRRLE